jgi:hypothetical protein
LRGAGPSSISMLCWRRCLSGVVLNDLLGVFTEFQPRFVKRYASLGSELAAAVQAFASDVRARRFPAAEHCYAMPAAELERLRAMLRRSRGGPSPRWGSATRREIRLGMPNVSRPTKIP